MMAETADHAQRQVRRRRRGAGLFVRGALQQELKPANVDQHEVQRMGQKLRWQAPSGNTSLRKICQNAIIFFFAGLRFGAGGVRGLCLR